MQGDSVRTNLNNFGSEMTYIFIDDVLVSIQYLILMNIMKMADNEGIDERIPALAEFFKKLIAGVKDAKFSLFILNRREPNLFPPGVLEYLMSRDNFELSSITSNLYDNMKALLHFKQNFVLVYCNDLEKKLAEAALAKLGNGLSMMSYIDLKHRLATASNKKAIALVGNLDVIEELLDKYEKNVFIYRPNSVRFYSSDIKDRTLGMDIW